MSNSLIGKIPVGHDDVDSLAWTKLRWSACFVFVAGLLVCAVWLAIRGTPETTLPPVAPPAAIMIDLTPLPATPPSSPTEVAPGPRQTISQPPPERSVQPKVIPLEPPVPDPAVHPPLPSTPPSPAPDVDTPKPPEPPPRPQQAHRRPIVRQPAKPHPDRTPPARATTAPPQIEAPPAPASASAPNVPADRAPPSNALPTWQGLLLGRLEQYKRYPYEAQYRRQQGVVYLRFSMDRRGKVLSASIVKSSGIDALDQETLALIHRAEPLPPPPAEVNGDSIELTVPVQFFLK